MTSPFGAFAHFIRNVRSSRDYYSSPLQWPLTTSSECGTWSIRQFFPHKSGDKCVQTPKNRRMDHRIPPATLETEAQRPASAHPERKYHFPTLIFQHPVRGIRGKDRPLLERMECHPEVRKHIHTCQLTLKE